jgi:hypothetical protein
VLQLQTEVKLECLVLLMMLAKCLHSSCLVPWAMLAKIFGGSFWMGNQHLVWMDSVLIHQQLLCLLPLPGGFPAALQLLHSVTMQIMHL